jgi:prepilin-type N-terminal cleavage/methylation domain-containing protein
MHVRTHGLIGRRGGFSLIELIVVAAVGAVVFTAGALAYRVVAKNQRTPGAFQEVTLPAGLGANFYPGSSLTSVDSYTAPNFGRCSQADVMRTLFLEEVEKSVAVFVLPRGGNVNTIRGRILNLHGAIPQALDTPAAFLAWLLANPDTAAAAQVFTSYRGAPPAVATTTITTVTAGVSSVTTTTNAVTNASIFLIQPSGSNGELWVRAVYEIDYVGLPVDSSSSTSPDVPCVFATVRRYVDDTLTHYYDIVYREAALQDVGIPFSHFERAERIVYPENGVDQFKKAGNHPFYLVWWPDPAVQRLKGTASTAYDAASPQAAYAKHEGQTSYVFVVPQFPAL